MFDLAPFTAAATSLQRAYELAKALLQLDLSGEVAKRVMELQREVDELRAKYRDAEDSFLACRHHALEQEGEIRRLKAFQADMQRYELKELGPHSFAYALRADAQGAEPPHHLCARCCQDAQKSILQLHARGLGFDELACPRCAGRVRVPNAERAGVYRVPRRSPFEEY